jgi:hypothetical protein
VTVIVNPPVHIELPKRIQTVSEVEINREDFIAVQANELTSADDTVQVNKTECAISTDVIRLDNPHAGDQIGLVGGANKPLHQRAWIAHIGLLEGAEKLHPSDQQAEHAVCVVAVSDEDGVVASV